MVPALFFAGAGCSRAWLRLRCGLFFLAAGLSRWLRRWLAQLADLACGVLAGFAVLRDVPARGLRLVWRAFSCCVKCVYAAACCPFAAAAHSSPCTVCSWRACSPRATVACVLSIRRGGCTAWLCLAALALRAAYGWRSHCVRLISVRAATPSRWENGSGP